jgi:hypothetical protein
MKTFLKKDNLQLLNGGYLSDAAGNPVFNQQFVDTQKHAEYVVEFARLAKTKDFKGKKADSLADLKKELAEMLDGSKIKEFVKKPETVVRPITDKLKEEAMSFLNFNEQSDKTTKINNFLQQFLILSEFEEFGLFFDADIVKLNKIYTMQDVIDAVTETIDLV